MTPFLPPLSFTTISNAFHSTTTTKILQISLGGNSIVLVIACFSRSDTVKVQSRRPGARGWGSWSGVPEGSRAGGGRGAESRGYVAMKARHKRPSVVGHIRPTRAIRAKAIQCNNQPPNPASEFLVKQPPPFYQARAFLGRSLYQ